MQKGAPSSTEPVADATQQRDDPPHDPPRPWQTPVSAASRASVALASSRASTYHNSATRLRVIRFCVEIRAYQRLKDSNDADKRGFRYISGKFGSKQGG